MSSIILIEEFYLAYEYHYLEGYYDQINFVVLT